MSDLDYSEAYDRIKIKHDFHCKKNRDYPVWWDCKKCKYFYTNNDHASKCLMYEIRDWTLFHIGRKDCNE